jgi:hypothetical protein
MFPLGLTWRSARERDRKNHLRVTREVAPAAEKIGSGRFFYVGFIRAGVRVAPMEREACNPG